MKKHGARWAYFRMAGWGRTHLWVKSYDGQTEQEENKEGFTSQCPTSCRKSVSFFVLLLL